MQPILVTLLALLLIIVGALSALGVVGVMFVQRLIKRMDSIEESLKNIKVEIVE